MKLFFLILFLFCSVTNAATSGIFTKDNKLIIIINTEGDDSFRLYESLITEPIEVDNRLKKHIIVDANIVERIYEIECIRSKVNPSLGSCTVTIGTDYPWTYIDKVNRSADLVPYGDLANYAAYSEFHIPNDSDILFLSKEQELKISVERDSHGRIFRFRLEYQQKQ
ncbi:MAG: hypothetical protein VX642_07675 [Bdellovibrionota bacterium]|nr:hypothetical protein [Bdellovibrionota bacterium]